VKIIEYCAQIFYNISVEAKKIRKTAFITLFLLMAVYIFPQNEMPQRGSIPEELLRPRRDEAPRYPVDTVIGAIGQGQASKEAYEIARKTATALLAGNMNVPVLSSVNKTFLEDCMTKLKGINPQSFRLGSGREEPDGSFSFLVRFTGREEGITGELFVRFQERRPKTETPPPPSSPVREAAVNPSDAQPADTQSADIQPAGAEAEDPQPKSPESAETTESGNNKNIPVQAAPSAQAPPVSVSAQKIWFFEDLILEEPRSREEENRENRHRFDFSPYERFY